MKKTIAGYLVYFAVFFAVVQWLVPNQPLPRASGEGLVVSQAHRVRLTTYGAIAAVGSHLIEAFHVPPPVENDRMCVRARILSTTPR